MDRSKAARGADCYAKAVPSPYRRLIKVASFVPDLEKSEKSGKTKMAQSAVPTSPFTQSRGIKSCLLIETK